MNSLDVLRLQPALIAFASATATQGQQHIKPIHVYVAARLVIEGGFLPDEVTPHPPLRARAEGSSYLLEFDEGAQDSGEQTVFGGMKTKVIDVVVAKKGIGPVVAVSVKGTGGAYRNLVNRMEEAIGDSTNVHVMYPGLVYGFMHFLRTNRETDGYNSRDMGLAADGQISLLIERYHQALCEMTGRRFVRNDFTRYEVVALAVVSNGESDLGAILPGFPPPGSPLRIERFFGRLYETYDLRFPFRAERLAIPRRVTWNPESPLFSALLDQGQGGAEGFLSYEPRLSP